MNSFDADRKFAERMKKNYPVGTRIELEHMDDPYTHIPPGTRGTVTYVDDLGQIGMNWDNGSSLGVVPGEDSFRKLTSEEVEEEKRIALKGMLLHCSNKELFELDVSDFSDVDSIFDFIYDDSLS